MEAEVLKGAVKTKNGGYGGDAAALPPLGNAAEVVGSGGRKRETTATVDG